MRIIESVIYSMLSDYKNLIFQVTKFHWNFPNHLYIHMDKDLFRNNKIKLLISWLENVYVCIESFL